MLPHKPFLCLQFANALHDFVADALVEVFAFFGVVAGDVVPGLADGDGDSAWLREVFISWHGFVGSHDADGDDGYGGFGDEHADAGFAGQEAAVIGACALGEDDDFFAFFEPAEDALHAAGIGAILVHGDGLPAGEYPVGDGKAEEGLREGKERENLAEMISRAAEQLRQVPTKVRYQELASSLQLFERAAESLRSIEEEVRNVGSLNYEQLELRLCTIEEKILAALVTASSEEALLTLRSEVNQELSRHRRGLKAEQLAMLEKKMINKKILEKFGVPRLSLFYMPLN